MKKLFTLIALHLLVFNFAGSDLLAQDLSKYSIAVVNMQEALNNSVKGKQSKAQIEQELKSNTAAFKAREEKIIKLRGELDNNLLNAQAKQKKIKELETLQTSYIRDRQATDKEIKSLEAKLTSEAFKELKELIASYAKSKSYNIVFEYALFSAMLYHELTITDITDEIIEVYDDKHTSN